MPTKRRWRELDPGDWRTTSRRRGAKQYEEQILLHEGTERERWVVSQEHIAAPDAQGADIERPLMASVGQSMQRGAEGLRSLAGLVTDPLFGENARGQIAEAQAARQGADAALWEQAPVQNIVGQAVPYLMGGALAAPGGLGAVVAAETAIGGIMAPEGERAQGAAVSGVLAGAPGVMGAMANRVSMRIKQGAAAKRAERLADRELADDMRPLEAEGTVDLELEGTATQAMPTAPAAGASRATHGYEQRLARAEELGYQPSPSQRTLDIGQEQWEAARARKPQSSAALVENIQHNQQTLNNQVMKALGYSGMAGRVSIQPAVIGRATDDIVKKMDGLADEIGTVPMGPNQVQALSERISGQALDITGDTKSVQPWLDKLADTARDGGGTLTGRQLLDARKSLVAQLRQSAAASKSNVPTIQNFINGIDDLIEASPAKQATINQFRTARERWRLLQSLQKGSVLDQAGNVSARNLANRLKKDFSYEFGRGHGLRWGPTATSGAAKGVPRYGNEGINELFDGVRWMSEAQSKIPNSGTPTGMADALPSGPIDLAGRLAGNTLMRGYMGAGARAPAATAAATNAMQGGLGGLGGMVPLLPPGTATGAGILGGASSPYVEQLLED